MTLVKATLDRFYTRLDRGDTLDDAEREEVRRMEALLKRWLRAVEEDRVREDRDKARCREGKGWINVYL